MAGQPIAGSSSRQLDDDFLALVLRDPELLRDEFERLVAGIDAIDDDDAGAVTRTDCLPPAGPGRAGAPGELRGRAGRAELSGPRERQRSPPRGRPAPRRRTDDRGGGARPPDRERDERPAACAAGHLGRSP